VTELFICSPDGGIDFRGDGVIEESVRSYFAIYCSRRVVVRGAETGENRYAFRSLVSLVRHDILVPFLVWLRGHLWVSFPLP